MILSDLYTKCPNCGIGSMIEDFINEERICNRCGFALEGIMEQYTVKHDDKMHNTPTYKLGTDRKFAFSKTDYTGNRIDDKVRVDLMTASKYDREEQDHQKAAISHITDLYDTMTYPTYDDGLKKGDLEILRQRAKNMVEATGDRQSELDLMKIIRKFVRIKLEKDSKLKQHFKLELLHMKIRHKIELPRNLAGRGNQVGKNRKEGRIAYCNLCKIEILNYKVKKHHTENHFHIPYHQYINKKNQYVRRSASLTDIIVDCSSAKEEELKNEEKGQCTNCNVIDATIRRYPRIEITKKERIDIVSRLVARHKDEKTGRWKACILQQSKIDEKSN